MPRAGATPKINSKLISKWELDYGNVIAAPQISIELYGDHSRANLNKTLAIIRRAGLKTTRQAFEYPDRQPEMVKHVTIEELRKASER